MTRKSTGRNRRAKDTITTKSGSTIKLNRSLSDRIKARKAARSADKAAYLATMPKDRFKRLLFRLHPKRVARFWFSRQGGIAALKIIGVAIAVGFFMTIGLFAYFRKDLPKIKDLSGDSLGGNITYYDRTSQIVLFNDYNSVKRIPVAGDAISKYMKEATVATEDKDFYKHGAFDVRGIMRAAYHDARGSSGSVQGGSTITQQLVKLNENWTNNRTVTRKVKELILAVELEREYSKDDILTGYLNIAPYGGQEYGVESAARDYFQTSA
jgi:membrane peptidoglycan carboxypeptidase